MVFVEERDPGSIMLTTFTIRMGLGPKRSTSQPAIGLTGPPSELRHREEQLEAARDDAERQLEQRRVELPTTEEIKGYVADFRDFLEEGTIPECKALIRNFVEGIEVKGDEAVLTYTIPMPNDGVTSESASVLDFVQSGPPKGARTPGMGC